MHKVSLTGAAAVAGAQAVAAAPPAAAAAAAAAGVRVLLGCGVVVVREVVRLTEARAVGHTSSDLQEMHQ
jgi:hypothetical protein